MSNPASGRATPSTGHGLPARPPPVQGGGLSFKPRSVASAKVSAGATASASQSSYQGPAGYNVNGQGYGSQSQANGGQSYAGNYGGGYDYSQYPQSTQAYAGTAGQYGTYNQPDVEWQQQMHAWQSNYNQTASSTGTGNANHTPLGGGNAPVVKTATPVTDPRKTVARSGGGQKWEDPTLLEWGNHHRIFVGNLAGEVTDDSLLKAFAKYPSVQKARVVREKRTTKSKGFGFVSFADADEYFQAAKDMQGKYIGSHPVLIKRAETEIKAVNKKTEERNRKKNNNNKDAKNGGAAGQEGGRRDAVLGPQSGGGVQKAKKSDAKYKVLG